MPTVPYRSTDDIAIHYQREVLPLRKVIGEEMRLRFSSMQVDFFALLVEQRQRIASQRAAIDAKREFFVAQAYLRNAVNRGGQTSASESKAATTVLAAGGANLSEMAMHSRRGFLGSAALVGASAVSDRVQAAAIPEAPTMDKTSSQPPLRPTSGPDYNPVVTLNGWTLPWRMNGDWKEFHLVAEPVVREFAPGIKVNLWGYNARRRAPRSRPSRATRSASSSPTDYPNIPRCTGTA